MNFLLHRRGARALLLAVFVAVGLGVGIAGPASAHARLVSISPADGATLTTPPTEVVVTFDDTVTAGLSVVTVKGPNGAVVSQGKPTEAKGVVTEPLVADLPGGTYSIAWKIVSDDGHQVSGTATFTVQTADASPLATATSTTPPTSSSSSSSSSAAALPTTSGTTGSSSGGLGAGAKGLLYILALAAVVYGVLGVFRARRRQQRNAQG